MISTCLLLSFTVSHPNPFPSFSLPHTHTHTRTHTHQLKGEIDDAGDSLRLLETQDAALQRAKKLYTQSVEQYVKQQKKMEKAKGDANLKNKAQVNNKNPFPKLWVVMHEGLALL